MIPERIKRHEDERLCRPWMHSRPIQELHRISNETGEPMTGLLDQTLRTFVLDLKLRKADDLSPKTTSEATDSQGDWFRSIQP